MYRTLNEYPPVVNLLAILITHYKENIANQAAELVAAIIKRCDLNIKTIGPTDCSVGKINDIYRKVIYIKDSQLENIISIKDEIENQKESNELLKDVMLQFDLNPMNSY